MKEIVKWILYIGGVFLFSFLFTHLVAMRAVVDGASMENTLYDKDNLIVEKLTYRLRDPKRFEIAICPGVPREVNGKEVRDYYIKRIIGLPGETIGIKDGKVTINGKVLEGDIYGKEDYIRQGIDGPAADMLLPGPYTLQKDEYFLMGDNRNNSRDSRDPLLGPVKREKLAGKVWIRIWPLSAFGKLH